MIIAIATESGRVVGHFGHCDQFTLYNNETGEYTELANPPHQPGMLPGYLRQNGADVIIAGGMGERAKMLFNELGIAVYAGIDSSVTEAVEFFNAGRLTSKDVFCQHHEHDHGCHSEG